LFARSHSALDARLAALRLLVKDTGWLAKVPGIAGLYTENTVVIGQQDAMGAVLVFESSVDRNDILLCAEARRPVRLWPKADIPSCNAHVCF
jgi:hypothetical protein